MISSVFLFDKSIWRLDQTMITLHKPFASSTVCVPHGKSNFLCDHSAKTMSLTPDMDYSDYEYINGTTRPPTVKKNSTKVPSDHENSWIVYTVIVITLIVVIVVVILIYDLCYRWKELRGIYISDGGPPASPKHQSSYLVTVKADSVSQAFDTKNTLIRVELLDHQNHFLTSFTFPTSILKFRSSEYPSNQSKNLDLTSSPSRESGPATDLKDTEAYDNWLGVAQSNIITFHLVRRYPLVRMSSVRLSHNCFTKDAFIILKHIIICDESTKQKVKVNLSNIPLAAGAPCPPSKFQVFNVEKCSED